ncbi:uncharacterized protein VTP21DRAFT_792 [Calcarisporiella thermophila]|uniref:uncharacterized protein n=1 Tax=Calcarisporiella thermophila TaxID=911321 RepID=UPI003743DB78
MAPLQVIGAGFGRTGTYSLMIALNELGFGPCYHAPYATPEHFRIFSDAFDGKDVDWDRVFNGFSSTVSWPTVSFYKQLMSKYPDAKLILTVRDSSEDWCESISKTIASLRPKTTSLLDRLVFPLAVGFERWNYTKKLDKYIFKGHLNDKAQLAKIYERHCEEVKRTVPADRLLVFNVKEGWEPLCKFLGVSEIPDHAFPRKNDPEEFDKIFRLPVEKNNSFVRWGLSSIMIALITVVYGLNF